MGLLDDAIREHLELKRKRGADPAEVEQQEREALGPVRGGAVAAATPETAAAEPALTDPEPPSASAPDDHAGAVRMPDPEPEPEPEAVAPPPAAPPAPADPPPPVSQPTQQYSVEDLDELRRDSEPSPPEDVVPADDEPAAEEEDVLDETPDFLQEAPEHDRLWFEQRPPRDFDF